MTTSTVPKKKPAVMPSPMSKRVYRAAHVNAKLFYYASMGILAYAYPYIVNNSLSIQEWAALFVVIVSTILIEKGSTKFALAPESKAMNPVISLILSIPIRFLYVSTFYTGSTAWMAAVITIIVLEHVVWLLMIISCIRFANGHVWVAGEETNGPLSG